MPNGKSSTKMPKEPKEVQVARISARQAIVVAVITALSAAALGVLTAYQTGHLGSHEPHQYWLTIKPITGLPTIDGTAVRVIAIVNSQAYSYPSKAVWADIGPDMSRESFPLPIGDSYYNVRFDILVRDPDGDEHQFTSQAVQQFTVKTLGRGIEREYAVYPLDEHFTRGAGFGDRKFRFTKLSIPYEIHD